MTRAGTQRRLQEQQLYEMCQCFARVYSTEDGRRVIEQICQVQCGEKMPSFSTDKMKVFNAAVRKDVANEIRGFLRGSAMPMPFEEVLPPDDMADDDYSEGDIRDE